MNVAKQVRRKTMSKRVADLVSEFGWALDASVAWPKLKRRARRAVVLVAVAEERANKEYLRADRAIERAKRRAAR